jgi:hypothetical protein
VFGCVALEEAGLICQDVSTQRLYFVDIDQNKVYTYEPSSDTIGYQTYDQKVTALALIADRPGVSAWRPRTLRIACRCDRRRFCLHPSIIHSFPS